MMKRKIEPTPMTAVHRIQAAIHDEIKRLTVKEKVAYYRRARKELSIAVESERERRKSA